MQFLGREIRQGHAQSAEGTVEDAHVSVVELFGIHFAGFELEGAVVAGQVAGQTDQHFSQRGVDVEVEFALEVVGAEFAEVCFVPGHDGGQADLVHAGEEGEEGEDEGCDQEFVLVEGLEEGVGLALLV